MKSFYCSIILVFATLINVAAEEFHVSHSNMEIAERGSVDATLVETNGKRYLVMTPEGCSTSSDESQRSITFDKGKAVLKLQWVDAYRNSLPDEETLRAIVLKRYPGAAVLQSHKFATDGCPGLILDVKRIVTPDYFLTVRYALLLCKGGAVEIELSAASPEFKSQLGLFSTVISSFHALPDGSPKQT